MNRIYQGKINRAEFLKEGQSGRSSDDWQECQDWSEKIWQHHRIFQDAVNYYLVALGALANPKSKYADENRVIHDLQSRLAEAWEQFPRQPAPADAKSLRDSVVPWIGLEKDATLQDAFDKVLERKSDLDININCLALLSLLADLGGEGKIQQGGRGYFPYFCTEKTKSHFPRGKVNRLKKEGKEKIVTLLWNMPDRPEPGQLDELKKELCFEYFANPTKNGEVLPTDESKRRLEEAAKHLCVIKKLDKQKEWIQKIQKIKSIEMSAYSGGSINKEALKNRFYAWLVFNYVEKSDVTFQILRSFIKEPKKETKLTKKKREEMELERILLSSGDDPIDIARGQRGYVFRAFTALPPWSPKSSGSPVWSEFDILAFKEALKTLNQFNQKTEEREKDREEIENRIAWMKEEDSRWMETEDSESETEQPPLKLAGDKRYDLATDLEEELSKSLREGEFHITHAGLRGFRNLGERWNKKYRSQKTKNIELTEEGLINIVKAYQSEDKNRKDMGSVPLFLALCQKKYWPLWLEADEEEKKDVLKAMAKLHTLEADLERKKEPIKLTPAEPVYSRRLFSFSDLMTPQQKEALPEAMQLLCWSQAFEDRGSFRSDFQKLEADL